MKNPPLINAQHMARTLPKTFSVPPFEDLASLKAGDLVKVSTGKQRFWVRLTEVSAIFLTGLVDNDLLDDGSVLIYGDVIQFSRNAVYQILTAEELRDILSNE